ncbi:hypothetical protein GPALN_006262 [Globodera pallida]|nr:hypothetical protein GPALN_006262 [Globodera pallida]
MRSLQQTRRKWGKERVLQHNQRKRGKRTKQEDGEEHGRPFGRLLNERKFGHLRELQAALAFALPGSAATSRLGQFGHRKQSKRQRTNEQEMISAGDDKEEHEHEHDGVQEEANPIGRRQGEEEEEMDCERSVEAGTGAAAAELENALNEEERGKKLSSPLAQQSAKSEGVVEEEVQQHSSGSGGDEHSTAADFRLRRPIERIRSLLLKRPMLAELLNPAFKRYVKRMPSALAPSAAFASPRQMRAFLPRRARGSSSASGAAAASTATAKRRVALQLLRRCLQSAPLLSRLPPFQCPKCSLLSRRPGVMLNHICAKKPAEFKNVTQIVELGFRSRVRDALAALERIPNPQAMQFTKFCRPFTEAAEHVTVHQPPRLSDIVLKFVQRWNTVQIVQTTQPVPSSHQMPCHSMTSSTTDGMANSSSSSSSSASSTGFFCAVCGRLFARYADWDAHLLDEEEGRPGDDGGTDGICPYSGQQPTPIEANCYFFMTSCPPNELFPRNGLPIISRSSATAEFTNESAHQNHSQRQQRWRCSTCALQHFATRAEFHAHLLKCALAAAPF